MRRILFGMMSMVALIALVSGSAYALFSDTVQVSGITLSTGNADLKISDSNGGTAEDALSLAETNIPLLYPGKEFDFSFWLKNASTSNIKLNVAGKLTAATNWPNLADAVYVNVVSLDDTTKSTGWLTLSQWNASSRTLPAEIPQGQYKGFRVYVGVDENAGNSIANKELKDIVFTLTGTQVTE